MAGNGSILIVPTTSYELGSTASKKAKTPKKNAIVCGTGVPDDAGAAYYDPRNFLVRGGARAFEQKILNMNKSAVQELRTANAVLAEELMKTRAGSDEVRDQLRAKAASVDSLQAQIDKLEKARKQADKKHLLQLKELNRRYKDEQAQRLTLEAECAQLRASKEVVEQQVESLQEERAQIMDMLNNQRSNGSRLEATAAADTATIAELRSRIQAAESRLQDEVAARQELFTRHKALEADFKLVSERNSLLMASGAEADGKLRAATSRAELLEDELQAAKEALKAEKAAFTAERQRASALQSDLTQLQTSSQLAAAAAAVDAAEVERLRGQAEQLTSANDSLRTDVARMREEVLHLTAQGVAAQASCQELQQQRDELQLQLASTRESLERRIQQLEVGWREDSAGRARAAQEKAAAAERTAAEELLAVKRAHVEELTAKQREWEAQLRLVDEERAVLQRAHEEELARKDFELLEVRERMRAAQASVADMATEVAAVKLQGEQYGAVFRECEELKQRLAQAEETVKARDASLAEAAASHAAQLELWKAEANEVAQAAAKWKQRCTALQAQLDEREAETDALAQELQSVTGKLTASEAERVKLQEAMASVESKLALAAQEANSYRAQLTEVLASHENASRQAGAAHQDLQLRDLQISKLKQCLDEEGARAAQLRQELSAAIMQHTQELELKRRALDGLDAQLRESERARIAAAAEAAVLRDKVSVLTREIGRARSMAEAAPSAPVRASGPPHPAAATPGPGAPPSGLQRPVEEPWERPPPAAQQQQQYGAAAAGGRSAAARRLQVAYGEAEDGGAAERAYHGGRGGGGGGHGRPAEDVTHLEEEAESWFSSLDEAPRTKGPGREAAAAPGGGAPHTSARPPPEHQPRHAAPTPHHHPQAQARKYTPPPPHTGATHISGGATAGYAPGSRAYDVVVSPSHSPTRTPAPRPMAPPPQPSRPPQPAAPYGDPMAQPVQPAAAQAAPPPHGAATPAPMAGAGAPAAGAAYTAVVMPKEYGGGVGSSSGGGYGAQAPAAAPQAYPPGSCTTSGTSSVIPNIGLLSQPYPHHNPYRAYGAPAAHPQPPSAYTQQPGSYGARGDLSRSYGVAAAAPPPMTPFSPVVSESASTSSANLQERLQRLLGTGTLL